MAHVAWREQNSLTQSSQPPTGRFPIGKVRQRATLVWSHGAGVQIGDQDPVYLHQCCPVREPRKGSDRDVL
jgi:hypothetical protein